MKDRMLILIIPLAVTAAISGWLLYDSATPIERIHSPDTIIRTRGGRRQKHRKGKNTRKK